MSQMSKDITPSVQVLGLSQAVPSKDMSRPNINTAVPCPTSPFYGIESLPDRWFNQYKPIPSVDCQIYEHLMVPPTTEEWIQIINSMPTDKAAGPSKISFEMLKHVGPECQKFLTDLFSLCLVHNLISSDWHK